MAGNIGGSGEGDDEMISGINVTPLVDITLVLLIVFIVTAKIIVGQTLPIDLPKAKTGGDQQVVFAVEVAANGEIAVNGAKVADEDGVLPLAKDALARNPDVRAVIDADEKVPHGKVVRVMDETKRAGITRIAFGVTPAR